MNKEDAQKEIEKNNQTIAQNKEENKLLKKANKQLQEIINAPGTRELVFKPQMAAWYEYLSTDGSIKIDEWTDHRSDFDRLKVGNVFRIETAKNSAKYEIMNSEYEYWHRGLGQPKPKVLPKKLQFWVSAGWVYPHSEKVIWMDNNSLYRWKRSEQ